MPLPMAQSSCRRQNSQRSLAHQQALCYAAVQRGGQEKQGVCFLVIVMAGTPVTKDKPTRERHPDIFNINFM